MADPWVSKCDGKISGKILVLGNMGSGKITLVQELACQSMFGKLRQAHWISKVQLSKHREAEKDSCFSPKVEFYSPQDVKHLKKTFKNLENIYREREEKLKLEVGLVTRVMEWVSM